MRDVPPWLRKENILFFLLASFMVADALVAEFVGTKIFSLEKTLGLSPVTVQILGYTFELNFTAGVLFWPLVFVITDLMNEYFGRKAVRFVSIVTALLIGYAFLVIYTAIHLEPADFWIYREVPGYGNIRQDIAFEIIFGQSAWIILGSITAFLIGQLVDAFTFYLIRRTTGEKMLWLRATGSTFVSQLIDSFVVIWIAFGLGQGWEIHLVLAVSTLNYLYKVLAAIAVTPLIYLFHAFVEWYLGTERAQRLKELAMQG